MAAAVRQRLSPAAVGVAAIGVLGGRLEAEEATITNGPSSESARKTAVDGSGTTALATRTGPPTLPRRTILAAVGRMYRGHGAVARGRL